MSFFATLALLLIGLGYPQSARAQGALVVQTCGTLPTPYLLGANQPLTQDVTGKACSAASVSASISGFTAASTGTPISVTTGGVSGTLPAGAVVVATNVGATNGAYCALGASATTSSQYIAPNGGWFAFTVGSSTQLTCITSTSTTTVNTTGGAGLPTGTGGGGGGGSGGNVTIVGPLGQSLSAASVPVVLPSAQITTLTPIAWSNSNQIGNTTFGATIASGGVASGAYSSGAFAAGSGTDGWNVTEGTKADAAWTSGSGSIVALLKASATSLASVATNTGASIPAGTNSIGAVTGNERWAAGKGQGLTWGAAFSTEVNSVVNGNAILSSVSISNATALDLFADISVSIGSLTTGSGAPYLGVYLYPLNQDASTYGDGRFGSSAAGPPLSGYFVCSIPLVPSVTQAETGSCRGILLPPGTFKFVLYNQAGATLASSSNTIDYRTYNRSLN